MAYIDDVIAATGGLQPGQKITFEQAKWLYSSGNPNNLTPDNVVVMTGWAFGSLQSFLDYYEAMLLRLTAQKAADDAYAAYTAARIATLNDATAMLVFDSAGRATDESVAAANEYQNYTAPAVAESLATLEAAQDNVAQTVQYIQAQTEAAIAAALPPSYTDAQLSEMIDQRLRTGMLPGQAVTYLVSELKVDATRATRLVEARFAVLLAEQATIEAAQAAARAASAQTTAATTQTAAAAATATAATQAAQTAVQTAQVAQTAAQTAVAQTSTTAGGAGGGVAPLLLAAAAYFLLA